MQRGSAPHTGSLPSRPATPDRHRAIPQARHVAASSLHHHRGPAVVVTLVSGGPLGPTGAERWSDGDRHQRFDAVLPGMEPWSSERPDASGRRAGSARSMAKAVPTRTRDAAEPPAKLELVIAEKVTQTARHISCATT